MLPWKRKLKKLLLLFLTSFLFCGNYFAQEIFFSNHLVEKENQFYRPFTNEQVYGDIYRYFFENNKRSENIFLGVVTKTGKQGHWTRYWDNGFKKAEGYYTNSKKEGLWIEWQENGKKYAEIFYNNGTATHLTNCIVENCP